MPGKPASGGSAKAAVQKKGQKAPSDEELTKRRKQAISTPLTYYWLKETLKEFASNKYFPDSILVLFALVSVCIAFPFYPIYVIIVLAVIAFLLTRFHPLAGLMALLFISLPPLIFQAPLLALLYVLFLTFSLVFGYKHYRFITLAFALIALPFSFLGFFLEIPALVIGILYIGLKRGALAVAVAIVVLPVLATLTNLPLAAPIAYNVAGFAKIVGASTLSPYLSGFKAVPALGALPSAFGQSFISFLSLPAQIPYLLYLCALALTLNLTTVAVQLAVWLVTVFAMVSFAIKSRSGFKGSGASLLSFIILGVYFGLTLLTGQAFSNYVVLGFVITPLALFLLEINGIDIVRALDVMKQDFISTFGDAFEDLTSGTHETLDDIGNYEQTKEELREAILAPIEHKGVAGAYNIKPTKGILLFGPPGTGKTLMMRALSNEIRARFFYVKSSSILSSAYGESSQMLSKIFTTARAHPPALLFFDELDGIARRRDASNSEGGVQLLSTLLSEMDGFQKIEGVVIVGATNVPNLIDPSIMRPGRFDRVIYMPLPDEAGRVAIFKHYAKVYPLSSDIDYDKLANLTARFSGADIANICRETATKVSAEAIKHSHVLKIDVDDLIPVIKATKPSTSYAQLEEYETFRLDYERRLNGEPAEVHDKPFNLDAVVGLADAKKALHEAITIPLTHPELMKEYDIHGISGILLFGPPGTGKTMLINAVANTIEGLTLISVSGADLVKEGYETALTKLKESFFRAKENTPSILFIDEIDSLVPSRENSSEGMVQLTAEFLRAFDAAKQSQGIVIVGSTNRPDAIDSAVIRPGRMDKLIYAGPPDREAREKLFRLNLVKCPVEEGLDYSKIAAATDNYTGADIANICREAKTQALENSIDEKASDDPSAPSAKPIGTADLLKIIKNSKPSAPPSVIGRYLAFLSEHGRS